MTEPVLLDVTRGGRVESRHLGSFVLLDAGGEVAVAAGDPEATVFGRSALKPLQASAMLRAGLRTDSAGVALAAASHDGEAVHLAGARAVLAAAGGDESMLACPPDLPWGRDALVDYVAGGGTAAPICHNCSGKHAGMVATCLHAGWEVGSYLSVEHPLQVAIVAELEQRCVAPVSSTSVDGCGAPAHALPLAALARGFGALSTAPDPFAELVRTSMRAHPRLVGGIGRAVTELTAEVDGLVCKDGAEGVWAAALPDGRAFAAKVSDGSLRALPPVLAGALAFWGFTGPAVRRWSAVDVLGGGAVVGAVTWSVQFRDLLGL
ncbi:MAG: asparaginase [Jatrophihabitans sp.]